MNLFLSRHGSICVYNANNVPFRGEWRHSILFVDDPCPANFSFSVQYMSNPTQRAVYLHFVARCARTKESQVPLI